MFLVPVSRRSVPHARVFDDAFERFFSQVASTEAAPRRPALDVSETDRHYVVSLDVPGVKREDVKVSIDGRKVGIVAEASPAVAPAAAATSAEPAAEQPAAAPAAQVLLRERAVARYARNFTLPTEIDQADSQARLDNGVLTLTLTKRAPTAARLTVE